MIEYEISLALAALCNAYYLSVTQVYPSIGVVWVAGIHPADFSDTRLRILKRVVNLLYPEYQIVSEAMTTETRLEIKLK